MARQDLSSPAFAFSLCLYYSRRFVPFVVDFPFRFRCRRLTLFLPALRSPAKIEGLDLLIDQL